MAILEQFDKKYWDRPILRNRVKNVMLGGSRCCVGK